MTKQIYRKDKKEFEYTELSEKKYLHDGHTDVVQYYKGNDGQFYVHQVHRVGERGTIIFHRHHKPEVLFHYEKELNA